MLIYSMQECGVIIIASFTNESWNKLIEPIKIVYRRPSNTNFLFNKGYYAYFVNIINNVQMIYTSTEKKAIDGPFFLEDFYYPEENVEYLFQDVTLTIDNFFNKIAFYREYWLEQLKQERYYLDKVIDALKDLDFKTLFDIYEEKLDINKEYYYSRLHAPKTILSYLFEHVLDDDTDQEKFFIGVGMLIEKGADLKTTSYIKGLNLFNYLVNYFCHSKVNDELIIPEVLLALLTKYGSDYHHFINGMHPFQKIYREIGQAFLETMLEFNDELRVSYLEIEQKHNKYRFMIPSFYLNEGMFDETKALSYLEHLKRLAPKKIIHILVFNNIIKVNYYPNILLSEIIDELDQFETLFDSSSEEYLFLYNLIMDKDYDGIKKALQENRDYLFEKLGGKNACLMALSQFREDNDIIPKILDLLISYGLDFDQYILYDQTLIVNSALNGHYFMVDYLLNRKVDYKSRCGGHWTLLEVLSMKDDFSLFKRVYDLITPPINAKDEYGITLLHTACRANNDKIVKFLLEEGYDPNLLNNYGYSPFITSLKTSNHNYQVFKVLIDSKRVDINYVNPHSQDTLLHICAESKKPYRVKLLIDQYQDVNPKNITGHHPLDMIFKDNNISSKQDIIEIHEIFIKKGGDFAYHINEKQYQKLDEYNSKNLKSNQEVSIVYVIPEETNLELAYEVPDDLDVNVGSIVLIPYGSQELKGEVIKAKRTIKLNDLPFPPKKLKKIIKVL